MGEVRLERMRQLIADGTARADPQGWVRGLCDRCLPLLQVDGAAIVIHPDGGTVEVFSASSPWAAQVIDAEFIVGDGPGFDTHHRGVPMRATELLATRPRWPGFTAVAAELGVRSALAVPLRIGGVRLGAFELFRTAPGAVSDLLVGEATVLAALAAEAILDVAEMIDRDKAEWRPLVSYNDVNVATGMIAGSSDISIDQALLILRGYAFARSRLIVDVADDVVARRLTVADLMQE